MSIATKDFPKPGFPHSSVTLPMYSTFGHSISTDCGFTVDSRVICGVNTAADSASAAFDCLGALGENLVNLPATRGEPHGFSLTIGPCGSRCAFPQFK